MEGDGTDRRAGCAAESRGRQAPLAADRAAERVVHIGSGSCGVTLDEAHAPAA